METLLPCPFCGSESLTFHHDVKLIGCDNCGCRAPNNYIHIDWNTRPAEKLVPSEKDFEQCVNEFSRRLEIKRGFGLVDTDRGWLHGHLKQFFARFASFKDEKLIPLDKVKIYHLIKKYFLMIPGDTHPTNIIHDNDLDNACDEIVARFGSVPVVPERKSDGRDS